MDAKLHQSALDYEGSPLLENIVEQQWSPIEKILPLGTQSKNYLKGIVKRRICNNGLRSYYCRISQRQQYYEIACVQE
jgi:hypothetical protein